MISGSKQGKVLLISVLGKPANQQINRGTTILSTIPFQSSVLLLVSFFSLHFSTDPLTRRRLEESEIQSLQHEPGNKFQENVGLLSDVFT